MVGISGSLHTFCHILHELISYIGLCFLPYGIGSSLASILAGYLMDYNYKRVAREAGFPVDIKRGDDMRNFPLEKARIQVVAVMVYLGIAAFVAYGWVLQQNAPLAVPLLLNFIIALFFTGAFTVLRYVVFTSRVHPFSDSL